MEKKELNSTGPKIPFSPNHSISSKGSSTSPIIGSESVVLKVSKTKRLLGCHTVSVNGIVRLPGASQTTPDEQAYFVRFCDQSLPGKGWTVIQRRGPPMGFTGHHDPLNFTRSWEEYKKGFGDLNGEFWWGNENIHRLSQEEDLTLRFDLWDFEGNHAVAEYDSFKLANESSAYRLSVSGYHGNASDSFSAHDNFRFSTHDRDNDMAPDCCPCAPAYGGGWWFFR
ncbi:ficolin-2-like [Hyalella azteca]|uniref:Ficolin-2-like n=1 Tax=Hyalella azteca TaxID=294128 RepID=A0A8B7NP71_HYAAZ|nr:ficolin-2-like [Hyalella azteca]